MIAHPERPRAVAGAVPPSGHRFENGYGWPMIAHLCSAETTSGHSYTFSSLYLFTANLYTLNHWEVLPATPASISLHMHKLSKYYIIRGRAPKAQGRGSNFFFSRGGLIF